VMNAEVTNQYEIAHSPRIVELARGRGGDMIGQVLSVKLRCVGNSSVSPNVDKSERLVQTRYSCIGMGRTNWVFNN